ncbi:nuclear transcription factor Y subunit C-2-like [Wolffia australiana]
MEWVGGETGSQKIVEMTELCLPFFWEHQLQSLNNPAAMKKQLLPLSRIKRMMKENHEIQVLQMRIGGGAPLLFSKACELFMMEVTFRAWLHAEMSNRQTIEADDIIGGVSQVSAYHFLLNVVQRRLPFNK